MARHVSGGNRSRMSLRKKRFFSAQSHGAAPHPLSGEEVGKESGRPPSCFLCFGPRWGELRDGEKFFSLFVTVFFP